MYRQYINLMMGRNTAFEMTIDTTKAGSASDTFILPAGNIGTYNAVIDWGDNTTSTITAYNDADLTHVYSVGGIYSVKINGSFPEIKFNSSGDRLKLMSINNWGINQWRRMEASFGGCNNLEIYATDIPDMSLCTSFFRAFNGCTSLTEIPNINQWNMQAATTLRSMFDGTGLTGHLDLSGWQLLSCADLGTGGSFPFMNNTNITSLDVSNWNFRPAGTQFNYFINNCDSLTTITGMTTWQNSDRVTNLTGFVQGCALISSLDFSGMDLSGCSSFQRFVYGNPSLNSLNLSGITLKSTGTVSLNLAFALCTSLTSITGIESFNSSAVNNLIGTFKDTGLTGDLDLTTWDVSNVTSLDSTFMGLSLDSLNISGWDCGKVTTWGAKFSACFYGVNCPYIDVHNITLRIAGVNLQYPWFSTNVNTRIYGLDTWDISSATIMSDFISGGRMTTPEYDATLIAWDTLIDAPDGLSVKFGSSQYTLGGASETSRNNLISTDLWTITDGGGI